MRYAILADCHTKKLQELFLQRHQLAMALVAQQVEDRAAAELANGAADGAVHPATTQTLAQARPPTSQKQPPAQYAVQPGESLQAWLQRLCEQLPPLKATVQSQHVLKAGRLHLTPPHTVPHHAPHLLGSNRVAFQAHLSYPEFVAAMGVQVRAHEPGDSPRLVACMGALGMLCKMAVSVRPPTGAQTPPLHCVGCV